MGLFGMALSRLKRVSGWCPRGYALTGAPGEMHGPMPPPHLVLWFRHCASDNQIEIIPHSLPCALRSCKPQASKAPKSVGRPVTLPTNHPPLWRSHEFTVNSLMSVSPSTPTIESFYNRRVVFRMLIRKLLARKTAL